MTGDQRPDSELLANLPCQPELMGVLYERHAAAVFRYLARRAGPAAAEDLLSEVFIAALDARKRVVAHHSGSALPRSMITPPVCVSRAGAGSRSRTLTTALPWIVLYVHSEFSGRRPRTCCRSRAGTLCSRGRARPCRRPRETGGRRGCLT